MSIVRATIVFQSGDGTQTVEIMGFGEPTEYTFDDGGAGSEVTAYIFTDPSSYIDDVTFKLSESDANITKDDAYVYTVEDELVTLTSQDEVSPASGAAQYPIDSSFTVTSLGGIGADTTIIPVKIGTRALKTKGQAQLSDGMISYKANCRKLVIKGQKKTKLSLLATLIY